MTDDLDDLRDDENFEAETAPEAFLQQRLQSARRALRLIDDACFDHACHGEGDDPTCTECIAVKALHAERRPT